MNGYKSYLGSILRGFAGAAGAVILGSSPPQDVSPKGLAAAAALYFLGTALKNVGDAHKVEKQTEAIREQTEAIKGAIIVPIDPTATVPGPVEVGIQPPPPRRRTGPDDSPA